VCWGWEIIGNENSSANDELAVGSVIVYLLVKRIA